MRTLVLTLAISWMIADMAVAANCCAPPTCSAVQCCSDCGAQKACQVICETKKVTKVVWRVECEDFCTMLPGCERECCSNSGCQEGCGESACCETGCDSCGDCDPCASLQDRKYVTPRCGKVRTRKKLVKDTITCEVPSFKCVVTACDACGACSDSQEVITEEAAPAPTEAPAPPTAIHSAPMPPVLGVSYNEILSKRP